MWRPFDRPTAREEWEYLILYGLVPRETEFMHLLGGS